MEVIRKEIIKETNMFMFAINADTRKQKNNGLVNKVSFEFDDHLILWFIYPSIVFLGEVETKLFSS